MGATWLTKAGIFNSLEEIFPGRDWGRKAADEKNLRFCYLFI